MIIFTQVYGNDDSLPLFAAFALDADLLSRVNALQSLMQEKDLLQVAVPLQIEWDGYATEAINPNIMEHHLFVFKASDTGRYHFRFAVHSVAHACEIMSTTMDLGEMEKMYASEKPYGFVGIDEADILDNVDCAKVEFDPKFFGGDYTDVGDFIYVPDGLFGGIEGAFVAMTELDQRNIVSYNGSERYTIDGASI